MKTKATTMSATQQSKMRGLAVDAICDATINNTRRGSNGGGGVGERNTRGENVYINIILLRHNQP
jgi:hypothetical protein